MLHAPSHLPSHRFDCLGAPPGYPRIVRSTLCILVAIVALSGGEPVAGPFPNPPRVATVAPETYVLFPGDRIYVSVFGHDDLSHYIRVPADGPVSFPLIGLLADLPGRTISDVREEIRRRLEDGFIVRPAVSITVDAHAARTATVVGAVVRPEPVSIDPIRPLTARQAIAHCGGFAEDADRNAIVVLRASAKGAPQVLAVGDPGKQAGDDPVLTDLDSIVVGRLGRVFVLGRVNQAGAVPVPGKDRLTVSKAISLAGGFDQFARTSKVQLIRQGRPAVVVDVDAVLQGSSSAEDPEVLPGDTVYVPESRF